MNSRNEHTTVLRAARSVFAERLDDETLIWDQNRLELHRLNAPATQVWALLRTWTTIARAVQQAVLMGLTRAQLQQCIDDLDALGLVEWSERTEPYSEADESPDSSRR